MQARCFDGCRPFVRRELVDWGVSARALGGAPENLVGLLIGDWLIHKRVRRWSEMQADQRNVPEPYEDAIEIVYSVRPIIIVILDIGHRKDVYR